MRQGDFVVLANPQLSKFELYNLRNDQAQTTDLSERDPDRLREMTTTLRRLNAEIEAEGPEWWKQDPAKKKKANTK
jgi:hypothetical protein